MSNFVKWAWRMRTENTLDKAVLSYPRACIAKSEDEDGTTMMIPVQPVLFFESVAEREGLTDLQKIMSFFRIGELVDKTNEEHLGFGEAYFTTSDAKLAEVCSRHGWVKYLFDPVKNTWLMKRKLPLPPKKSLLEPKVEQTETIDVT
jgi:hypothetical protein